MRVRVIDAAASDLVNQTVVVRLGVRRERASTDLAHGRGSVPGLADRSVPRGHHWLLLSPLRALRPLDSMARRARQINAEHLNERLELENPDDELGPFGYGVYQ